MTVRAPSPSTLPSTTFRSRLLTAGKIAAMEPLDLREVGGAVEVRVRVTPRARRTVVGGAHGGALKIAVTAPPVEGEANAAVIDALADALGVPRRAIAVVRGATSREKTLRIAGVHADRIRALA
jgi:uncharacterized protein (TIGR00251 family)